MPEQIIDLKLPQEVKLAPEQRNIPEVRPIIERPVKSPVVVNRPEVKKIDTSNNAIIDNPPPEVASYSWQGIPLDVIRHFNVELGTAPNKDLEQLRDITKWAKSNASENQTIGDILEKISKVQRQLGAPGLNEKAFQKVWLFIKSQTVIDDMMKRQESLVNPYKQRVVEDMTKRQKSLRN